MHRCFDSSTVSNAVKLTENEAWWIHSATVKGIFNWLGSQCKPFKALSDVTGLIDKALIVLVLLVA